jgi:hypothetical protein
MPAYARATVGFEQLTVSSVALSLTVPAAAHSAWLTCDTQNVRYRIDGVAPTTTTGHVLQTGQVLEISGRARLLAMRLIRSGGTDSTLSVTYLA